MEARRFWLSLGLGLALIPAAAADAVPTPPENSRSYGVTIAENSEQMSRAAAPVAASGSPAATKDSADKSGKTPRLKFRGKDGTCACDCASGGTSEEQIMKAEKAREHADHR